MDRQAHRYIRIQKLVGLPFRKQLLTKWSYADVGHGGLCNTRSLFRFAEVRLRAKMELSAMDGFEENFYGEQTSAQAAVRGSNYFDWP